MAITIKESETTEIVYEESKTQTVKIQFTIEDLDHEIRHKDKQIERLQTEKAELEAKKTAALAIE